MGDGNPERLWGLYEFGYEAGCLYDSADRNFAWDGCGGDCDDESSGNGDGGVASFCKEKWVVFVSLLFVIASEKRTVRLKSHDGTEAVSLA